MRTCDWLGMRVVGASLWLALGLLGCGDTIVNKVVSDAGSGQGDGDGDQGGGDGGGDGDGDVSVGPVTRPCERDDECDNGLFCDGMEFCNAGRCDFGDPVECDDDVECTRDHCSEESRACRHLGPDADGDGHVDAACVDGEGLALGDDCDDTDSNRFPGNVEFCDDAHDEDCDLTTFGVRDQDRDGFIDAACCNAAGGEQRCGEDCDDESRVINPVNPEVCDGFDNNCNGETDEGLLVERYPDDDGDGEGRDGAAAMLVCPGAPGVMAQGDCDDGDRARRSSQVEICDEVDNDCDGNIDEDAVAVPWYFDLDGDGFGNAQSGTKVSCTPVLGASLLSTDCNDHAASIYPGAEELCDGIDNDCDGEADYQIGPGNGEDDDGDGRPDPACLRYPEDCDDEDDSVYPGALELCDGIDNDCNGVADANAVLAVWFRDDDHDGYGDLDDPGLISCEPQPGRVRELGDCDDGDAARNPDAGDDCGGRRNIDDDCDGEVDEAETAAPFYPDLDLDGWGNGAAQPFFACSAPDGYSASPADCDDSEALVAPGADEMCAMRDGIDNDCDGDIDCEDMSCQAEPSCAELYSLSLRDGPLPNAFVTRLSSPVTLVLKDQGGTPVVGQDITFTASEGADVTPKSAVTDANGEVQVQVRPGRAVATYTFTARQADVTPFVFTVDALRPPAGHIYTEMNTSFSAGSWPNGVQSLPATVAPLYYPTALATASDGTTYVAASSAHRVYVVSPRGEQRVLAGIGSSGTEGDGEPALTARLYSPGSLLLDEARHRLYVGQNGTGFHGRIRVIDLQTGLIDTFAGGSDLNEEPYGDGGSAKQAYVGYPYAMGLGPDGSVYFTDDYHDRIRRIDPLGIIRTVIAPSPCVNGDRLRFQSCSNQCNILLTDDGGGFLAGYFCGTDMGAGNSAIRGVAYMPDVTQPHEDLVHVAGQYNGDSSGSAVGVEVKEPSSMVVDPAGNLLYSDMGTHRLRRVDATTSLVTTVAGTGTYSAQSAPYGDHGLAIDAELYSPRALELTPEHDLRFADHYHHAVRVVTSAGRATPTPTAMEMVSGQAEVVLPGQLLGEPFGLRVSDPGTDDPLVDIPVRFSADQASFYLPTLLGTTDIGGVVAVSGRAGIVPGAYVLRGIMADIRGVPLHEEQLTVTVVAPDPGMISTIVNSSHQAGNRLTEPATQTQLNTPGAVAAASDGSIYIADYSNHRILRVTPAGTTERFAGGNGSGYSGDGGAALDAQLSYPSGLALDEAQGVLYVSDRSNNAIRVIDLATGGIDLFAGRGDQVDDPWGVGGPALDATFYYPESISVGPDGYLYVTDTQHTRILRMPIGTAPELRTVELVIGQQTCSSTPGAPLVLRSCSVDCSMGWTAADELVVHGYFCGPQTNGGQRYVVALRDAGTGEWTAIAGQKGSGNGFGLMPADEAVLGDPGGLLVNADDTILVVERSRNVVRLIDALDDSATIRVAIGTGVSGSGQPAEQGEWGPADEKALYYPNGIARDAAGRVILSGGYDDGLYRVW